MPTLVRGGTLIDGTGSNPKANAAILLDDDRIAAVSQGDALEGRAAGATIVDARGLWIVPGLMDMHIHMCPPYHQADKRCHPAGVSEQSVALATSYGIANARNLIAKGVTTVRDLGSHGDSVLVVRELVKSGQAVGPRILAFGRDIAPTGGGNGRFCVFADGTDEVRRAARLELANGADGLKFHVTGSGISGHSDVRLTVDEVRAGVDAAKGVGKTTAAHATTAEGVIAAVRGGIDSIEHGTVLDAATVEVMRSQSVFYCPTVWDHHSMGERAEDLGFSVEARDALRESYALHHQSVETAHSAGVAIVAGSDSALPINPRESLIWELEWLVKCGLTPMEAIVSATATAARLVQLDGELGTIEVGKRADVLCISGDPLREIRNLADTVLVLKDGVVMVEHGRLVDTEVVRDLWPLPPGPVPT